MQHFVLHALNYILWCIQTDREGMMENDCVVLNWRVLTWKWYRLRTSYLYMANIYFTYRVTLCKAWTMNHNGSRNALFIQNRCENRVVLWASWNPYRYCHPMLSNLDLLLQLRLKLQQVTTTKTTMLIVIMMMMARSGLADNGKYYTMMIIHIHDVPYSYAISNRT